MLIPVIHHTVVHLIRKHQNILLNTNLGNLLQLLLGEHFANRVMRGVDNHRLGFGSERSGKFIYVERPVSAMLDTFAGRRVKGHKDGFGTLEVDRSKVLVKVGFDTDDFIPGLTVRRESGKHTYTPYQFYPLVHLYRIKTQLTAVGTGSNQNLLISQVLSSGNNILKLRAVVLADGLQQPRPTSRVRIVV